MNSKIGIGIVFGIVVLAGMIYASENTIGNNALNLTSNSASDNSLLMNSSNSMLPIGINRPANVTCFASSQNVPILGVIKCGGWSVFMANASSSNSIGEAQIIVYTSSAKGVRVIGARNIENSETSKICMNGYDEKEMHNDDGNFGSGQRCLFITVGSISSNSAEIQLVGVKFTPGKPHGIDERNERIDERNEENKTMEANEIS